MQAIAECEWAWVVESILIVERHTALWYKCTAKTCNHVDSATGCQNHQSAYPCGDGTRCQCVAAIFKLCGLTNTRSWRKGIKVMGNCGSIPKYTAIATFPNGVNYDGHAAVFISCSRDGIYVKDQWCGHPFNYRTIGAGSRISNNADNFYVIN